MAIATGQMFEVVRHMVEAIDRHTEAYKMRDEVFAQLRLLAKRQKRQQPCKSHESPYAKFDRIRRKRK